MEERGLVQRLLLVVATGALVLVAGRLGSTPRAVPEPTTAAPVVSTVQSTPPPRTELPPGLFENVNQSVVVNEDHADQLDQQASVMQQTHNPDTDGTRALATGIRRQDDTLADNYDNVARSYDVSNPLAAAMNHELARRTREYLRLRRAHADASVHP